MDDATAAGSDAAADAAVGIAVDVEIDDARDDLPAIHRAMAHSKAGTSVARLRALIAAGVDVEAVHPASGSTALHRILYVHRPQRLEVLRLLLGAGADPYVADRDGCPLLHALCTWWSEGARLLLEWYPATAAQRDGRGRTALMVALAGSDTTNDELLLARTDLDALDAGNRPVLWYLCATRSPARIARGVRVGVRAGLEALPDLEYRWLLRTFYDAARAGDQATVEAMLALGLGVDVRATHALDTTALECAVRGGQEAMAAWLLERGAAIDAGRVLTAVVHEGPLPMLAALLARGIDVDAPGRFGHNALDVAARLGRIDAVRMLLAAGARADRRDSVGLTAADKAIDAGAHDCAALLRQATKKT